ncbi:MAG: hypothetical protein KGH63_03130 [Candidatus Micrarchaeota archaeon]|nr:hypothetical protein [Candidatus Micrarchaeota archaeon]
MRGSSSIQVQSGRRFAAPLLFVLLAALLALPALRAASQAQMAVSILDADGRPVPDVLVALYYQKNASNPLLDGYAEGFTDSSGQWRGSIIFPDNVVPPATVRLMAYTPYWSSDAATASISTAPNEELDASFTIPTPFETYRVQFSGAGGPISGAQVQVLSPQFLARQTDSNGLVQMRLPTGMPVSGTLSYSGQSVGFDFASQSGLPSGQPRQVTIHYPFENASPSAPPALYNLTVRAIDSNGRLSLREPFAVQTPAGNLTYVSDGLGYLRLLGVPYSSLNVSWTLYNLTYNATIDMAHPPAELRTPVLLAIQAPQVVTLGESCYRVIVNVADPRPDAVDQVSAQSDQSPAPLPFALEQRLPGLPARFSRVFCVGQETSVSITASNQYESTSQQIQLRPDSLASPPPAANGTATIGATVPAADTTKADEAFRVELLVILLEMLVFLAVIYVLVRFRDIVMKYGQIVLHSLHEIYAALRRSRIPVPGRKFGGPPPSPPPPIGEFSG